MAAASPSSSSPMPAREPPDAERASAALQRTVDVLSRLDRADAFIPAVLLIVADVFGAKSCCFCEHPDETIYLRFWLHEGRVLGPTELPNVDPVHLGAIRRLAGGFTAPYSHLGVDLHARSEPSVVEHRRREGDPNLQAFALEMGWDRELNVPLVVSGRAIGGLVIYRSGDAPFEAAEIALGSALGKQLALALQVEELVSRERTRVRGEEVLRAAEERARLMDRAMSAMQRCADSLVEVDEPRGAIVAALRAAAQVLDSLGVHEVGLIELSLPARTVRCNILIREGELQDIAGSALDRHWPIDEYPMKVVWNRASEREPFVWGLTSDTSVLVAEARPFHEAMGARAIGYVPLARAGEVKGWIAVSLRDPTPPSPQQISLVRALATHVVLAMELERIANESRDAALAEERASALAEQNRILRHRETVLAATNEATRILLGTDDLAATLPTALERIAKAAGMDRLCVLLESAASNGIGLSHFVYAGYATVGVAVHADLGLTEQRNEHFPSLVEKLHAGESYWLDLGDVDEEGRKNFARLGVQSTAGVPIFVAGRYVGLCAFDYLKDTKRPQPLELDVLAITGRVIASAFERKQAAEERAAEREAAARAVERARAEAAEAHLALLQAANDTLRRGTERVGQEGGLEALLGAFLLEAMHVSGASGGGITGWRDQQFWKHHAIAQDGALVPFEAWRDEPMMLETAEVLGRDDGGFASALLSRPILRSTLAEARSWWPAAAEYHGKRGHVEVWNVPCALRGRLLAHLGLAFREPRELDAVTVGTLTSLAQQMTLALELTRLGEVAKQSAIEVESARAVSAERSRMAGEIHDSLAQSFTSIAMQSESLIADLDAHSPLRDTLEIIEETARLGLAEARSSVLALRPIGDAVGELQNALSQLAERCNIAGSVTCEFRTRTEACALGADVRDGVLRVAQEAVNNALRHARAKTLVIEFDVHDGEAVLTVRDDGIGIEDATMKQRAGFGLAGMRGRAESLGGTLAVSPGAERGTTIRMAVPCHADGGSPA